MLDKGHEPAGVPFGDLITGEFKHKLLLGDSSVNKVIHGWKLLREKNAERKPPPAGEKVFPPAVVVVV
jgi:hypothetical protein